MQLFNKNEGTFTPDALIVSPDFPILTGGIGLPPPRGKAYGRPSVPPLRNMGDSPAFP